MHRRGEKPGRIHNNCSGKHTGFLCTCVVTGTDPRGYEKAEHPVMRALIAGDRDAFYEAETEARRHAGAPPFGRWAAIIVSSEDEAEAREAANRIGGTRPQVEDVHILGPAPAPLAMLRGRHRFRLLLHAPRSFDLQGTIRDWVNSVDWPAKARLAIDIDPYSFV